MLTPEPQKPPFPVLESFAHGCRFAVRHIRLFAVLSFFPLAVTLATIVALRLSEAKLGLFWLPIVQLPSSFVIGLQCALILRFLVLHEYPIIEDGPARALRNRAVSQAAFVYMAVTYFVTGAYAGLIRLRSFFVNSPEEAAPYAPLAIAMMALLLWAMRWFWLHVPVALDWPVGAFYQRVGRWAGTLRIAGLFVLSSLFINLFGGFLRALVLTLGGQNPSGIFQALDDMAVALSTLVLAVLFTCVSAAAVKLMAGVKMKDIEA